MDIVQKILLENYSFQLCTKWKLCIESC